MSLTPQQIYEFGPFRLEPAERRLLRHGQPIPLMPKVFDTLLCLVRSNGHLVEKDELMTTVWPDTIVEESSLTRNISVLRGVLEDGAEGVAYIETVPKAGYRFVAPVREVWSEEPELVLERRVRATIVTEEEEESVELEEKPLLLPAPRRHWRLRLGLALAAVGVFLAVLLGVNRDRLGQWLLPQPPKIGSLAVLPLENLTGNPEEDYFVDGVTDGLITHLAKLRRLRVISRTSAMRYKGTKKPLLDIARELNVDAVVTGTVVRSSNRVRINVQLLHAQSDRHLWAENYEGQVSDVWRFQGQVARAVADEIGLELTSRERTQLVASHAVHPEAYAAFLRGRYFWNKRTLEAFRKALEHFQQAVTHDPAFAPAHAGLADTYALLGVWSAIPMPEAKQKAEAAARKALELDPTLTEAHTSIAFLMALDCSSKEYPEAEKGYRRALELNPNYATAHHWYALYLSNRGRFDEARAEILRARELDPLSAIIQSDVGFIYYRARQFDQAMIEYRKALELDPNFEVAQWMLPQIYLKKGMKAEAVAIAEKAYANADNSITGSGLACVYMRTGKAEQGREILRRAEKHNQGIAVRPAGRAMFYSCIEDKEQTLALLEKALQENRGVVCDLNLPSYDFLRDDPRFQALVRRDTPSQ